MSLNPHTLEDLPSLVESVELECKLAQGQDGKGELPKDFWLTYSAFANTQGGVVLLGVREKDGRFSVAGYQISRKYVLTCSIPSTIRPRSVSIC
jgi:predicted HTH transcriptional regulator